MKLSLQDKLALALTSAGSQRALARQLGVSHQKVGRWLREGEAGGIKAIPPDAGKTIGKVFEAHRQKTIARAKEHGLPYSTVLPIYAERKPLQTGALGDRVFVEHTQHIKRATLDQVVKRAHQSRKFAHVSARSVVDIHTYAREQARIAVRSGKASARAIGEKQLARDIADAIEGKQKRRMADIDPRPLFTAYTPIFPGSDLGAALDELNSKLREKHEPATGLPGTRLSDQLLFQLMPKPKGKK